MPTMKPEKLVVARFTDAKMSRPELYFFMHCVEMYDDFNPFNQDIDPDYFSHIIYEMYNSASTYRVYFDKKTGLAGTEMEFGTPKGCYNCDRHYRYTLKSRVSDDRKGIQIILTDWDDEEWPQYFIADLDEEDLYDTLDCIDFAGDDELWDEVVDD